MAGHSKFKNIMHRKGRQDAVRARVFAKLSKEITVAAKLGGEDPDMNPRLRLAIQNAKSQSMPKDNIGRAVSRSSSGDDADFEEIRYEGYGPGGIAVIVEALTDNRNRSASSVRTAFSKHGGNLAETGSVSFMFERMGEITYPLDTGDEETMLMHALEAGAEDIETSDENHTIYCAFEELGNVANALEKELGEAEGVNPIWKAGTKIEIDGEKAETILKLLNALEDNEDVQNVYSNLEMTDEVMELLENS